VSPLEQWILVAFKVVDVAAITGTALWIGVYTYLAKWWATPLGATVVRLAIYLGGAFLLAFASLFFHFNRTSSDVAGIIDVGFYGLVAAELFYRVPMWIRLHMRTDGTRSYTALRVFAAEVWRRRGRPLWWGTPASHGPDGPSGPQDGRDGHDGHGETR